MPAKQWGVIETGEQSKKDKEDKEKEKTEAPASSSAAASQQAEPESQEPKTVSGMCACSLMLIFPCDGIAM